MTDRAPALLRRVLVSGVALAVIVGAVSVGLGLLARHDREAERSREVLVAAARQCAESLTTVDHARVESDVQRILNCATGEFLDDFAARAAPFIDVVTRLQSTSTGVVTEAAMESVDGDEGVALVAVAVRTVVGGVTDARPRYLRMRLTVSRDGPEARIAKVDFVE